MMKIKPDAIVKMQQYQTEKREESDKEMAETFEAADKDKNGLLDQDEFVKYMQMTSSKEKEQFGDAASFDEVTLRRQFDTYYDKVNGKQKGGVSLDDLRLVEAIFEDLQKGFGQ